MTRVVAAIIRDAADPQRFFIAKRAYGSFTGCWEFPGGKIEAEDFKPSWHDFAPSIALARELVEEGVAANTEDIHVGSPLFKATMNIGEGQVEITHFAVSCRSINLAPPVKDAAHSAFRWVDWLWLRSQPVFSMSPGMVVLVASNREAPQEKP